MTKQIAPSVRVFGYMRGGRNSSDITRQKTVLLRAGVAETYLFADLEQGRRSAFARLLGELRADDILIVPRLDRLGVKLDDVLGKVREIRARGVILSIIKEGIDGTKPSGRLAISTLVTLPELSAVLAHERAREISERRASPKRLPGRPSRLNGDLLADASVLLSGGLTKREVAQQIGVGRSTLYQALGAAAGEPDATVSA